VEVREFLALSTTRSAVITRLDYRILPRQQKFFSAVDRFIVRQVGTWARLTALAAFVRALGGFIERFFSLWRKPASAVSAFISRLIGLELSLPVLYYTVVVPFLAKLARIAAALQMLCALVALVLALVHWTR